MARWGIQMLCLSGLVTRRKERMDIVLATLVDIPLLRRVRLPVLRELDMRATHNLYSGRNPLFLLISFLRIILSSTFVVLLDYWRGF